VPVFQARDGKRLRWRVIVHSASTQDGSHGGPKMAWHMVECADPLLQAAHCMEGRLRLSAGSDPDGHCLIGDACPRCTALDAAKVTSAVPEISPPPVAAQPTKEVPDPAAP